MERGRRLVFNTILLTATSFLMRAVAMAFQVYLSRRIGADGIGLFQLVMSVSVLAATFAISGVRFAAMRLIAEELGRGNEQGAREAVRRCLMHAAVFGTAAAAALWLSSGFVATEFVGSAEAALSLRLLAISLPAMAAASVFNGYFTAVCRPAKSAAAQVAEQLIRTAAVIGALALSPNADRELSCAIIVAGGVLGDIFSFALLAVLYWLDRRKHLHGGHSVTGLTRRLLRISMPLALSAYARTALSMVQNLLVPRGFRRYGMTQESALAEYGIISGMVFPIITFPSAFFYSLADLLAPELTEAQVSGQFEHIERLVSRTLRLSLLFSLCAAAVLFRYSGELGLVLYKSERAGTFVRVLALLVPIMYLDSVTDGMLRGLGEHMYSMRVNIADSVISVALVYLLLPRFAAWGYVFVISFTEVFNFILSIVRLRRLARIRLSVRRPLKATFCAMGSVNIAMLLLRTAGLPLEPSALSLALHIVLTAAIYLPLLLIFRCVDRRDVRWLGALMH